MVSQSSIYVNPDKNVHTHGPERAVDHDPSTLSHTLCHEDTDVWYRIELGSKHYVNKVSIINFFNGNHLYQARMDGTKILVINNNKEELCGTLDVPDNDKRQIYSINCENMFGDGVVLRGKNRFLYSRDRNKRIWEYLQRLVSYQMINYYFYINSIRSIKHKGEFGSHNLEARCW